MQLVLVVFVVSLLAALVGVDSVNAQPRGSCAWRIEDKDVSRLPPQLIEDTRLATRACSTEVPAPVPPDTILRFCSDLADEKTRTWNINGTIYRESCVKYPVNQPQMVDFTLEGKVPHGSTTFSPLGKGTEPLVLYPPQPFDVIRVQVIFPGKLPQDIIETDAEAVTAQYVKLKDEIASLSGNVSDDLIAALDRHLIAGYLDQVEDMLQAAKMVASLQEEIQGLQGDQTDLQDRIARLEGEKRALEGERDGLRKELGYWRMGVLIGGLVLVLSVVAFIVVRARG